MSIYRARSLCPICSSDEEIWFMAGKVEPLEVVECRKCSQIYEPADFIYTFIELHNNVSVSSNTSLPSITL